MVASWTWDAQDETCGICRMAFDGCCPDYKIPGDDCPLSKVLCFHFFTLYLLLRTHSYAVFIWLLYNEETKVHVLDRFVVVLEQFGEISTTLFICTVY